MTGRNPQVWSRLSGTVTDFAGARGGKDPIDKHPAAPLSAEDKHKHTYIIIADIVESSLTAAHRYSTVAKSNHSTTSLSSVVPNLECIKVCKKHIGTYMLWG